MTHIRHNSDMQWIQGYSLILANCSCSNIEQDKCEYARCLQRGGKKKKFSLTSEAMNKDDYC